MRKKLFLIALTVMATSNAGAQSVQWGYEGKIGPERWARLDGTYLTCTNGRQQSPLDIRGAKPSDLAPLEFHYRSGLITLVNDGHFVQGNVEPGSFLVANGHRYDLVGFQFHHPSEQAVKGQLSDMEVQLLHKDSDGKMAIVSIRMREGNPNVVLAALWPLLPGQAGKSTKTKDMVNVAGLLPPDRGYWTYQGSLTTPPCSEGVDWFVLKEEIEVSRDQLQTFGALYSRNSRPLQPPHDRKIQATK
jgi:carbonic anhydrase